MLEVNNGWVITDNTWLWKADHCVHSSGQRLEGEDSFMMFYESADEQCIAVSSALISMSLNCVLGRMIL